MRTPSFKKLGLLALLVLMTSADHSEAQKSKSLPTEDPAETNLHPILKKGLSNGPYKPSWASLSKHPLPKWFRKDKIGLSAHWGPYAVPGWTAKKDTPYGVAYAEWYWKWMLGNERKPRVAAYQEKTYGGVGYDEFINGTKNLTTGEIDGFYAKDFDADAWMELFARAGMRYFFITSKHHDGYCIFDSDYTKRDSVDSGPKRDLLGELVKAARKRGIRVGVYYSYYEWHNPSYTNRKAPSGEYFGFQELADVDRDGKKGEYIDDFMVPQLKELIDKYQPDLMYFDGEWDYNYQDWRSRQIMAYYYNQAASRGQEVLMNDRFGGGRKGLSGTRGVYGDIYHVEYRANVDRTLPWAMWRGFGNSYGYNRNEPATNILSIQETIRMMINVVADNGNMEFNIGPKADGTIADFEVKRLEALGDWLSKYGESIYETTPGPTGISSFGRSTQRKLKNGDTRLYLQVYEWPTNGTFELDGLTGKVTKASLLGEETAILAKSTNGLLTISQLPKAAPNSHASVIAVDFAGDLVYTGESARAGSDGIISATPEKAQITGSTLRVESLQGHSNLGYWTNASDTVSWQIRVPKKGKYKVVALLSCADDNAGSVATLSIGTEISEDFNVAGTAGWQQYEKQTVINKCELPEGVHTMTLSCKKLANLGVFNLRDIRLIPIK